MRWSMRLTSPSLVAGRLEGDLEPADVGRGPGALKLGPDADGRSALVEIRTDGRRLEFSVRAQAPALRATPPPYPEWYFREHLVVFLNPGHDHATRRMYAVDDAGEVIRKAEYVLPGEEAHDLGCRELPQPPVAHGRFLRLGERSFLIRLSVPVEEGWADAAQPLGLGLKIGFHEEQVPALLQWPAAWPWGKDVPLAFGDLYLHPPALRVEALEFVEPAWGGEPSTLLLEATRAQDAPRSGELHAVTVLPGDSEQVQPAVAWRAEGQALRLRAPVVFPHRGKWTSHSPENTQLHLELRDEAGRPLWRAAYPFGFDSGVIVRERFGPRGGELPGRPEPSDPDFVSGFRNYVLARLPNYRRRTTREGACSDFFLEDKQGRAHLDLSAASALDQVAAMLAERFPDWQDALCATAMWMYHPCVTRHSGVWMPLTGGVTVDSIPRLGGCGCGNTALLGAHLAEKIGACLKVPLTGYSMGLRGHLATLVGTPIGRVVIDGMIGLWYHTLDNRRLATLEELRACAEIATRMWYTPRAHGHEYFYGVHDQIVRLVQEQPLRWPEATE